MNTLLFPGSFSPFTDGHYGIISRYLAAAKSQNINIDKVLIVVSSKPREGIDAKSVFKFISQIYSNDKRFEIKISGDNGPIRTVYGYVNNLSKKGDNFLFVRSSKDDDAVAENFIKDYSKGGKYAMDGVGVIQLDGVSDAPIVYKNRKDEFNGKPISGSVVRNDLRNKDYNAFLTSYQNILRNEISINQNHLKNYFNEWCKVIGPATEDTKDKMK